MQSKESRHASQKNLARPGESVGPSVLHQSIFLHALPFGLLGFLLPILGRELGATAVEIGGLFSVYSLTLLLIRPIGGWMLDRHGRRPFFVSGIAGSGVAMLLFAFTDSVEALFVARIVQGTSAAFIAMTTHAMVADLAAPTQRGAEMGRIDEVSTRGEILGIFVGFTLFGLLGEGEMGRRFLFCMYAAIIGIAAILAWRHVPESYFIACRKSLVPTLIQSNLTNSQKRGQNFSGHLTKSRDAVDKPLALLSLFQVSDWVAGLSSNLLRLMLVVFVRAMSLSMLEPIFLIYLQDKITSDMMMLAWAFFPAGIVFSILPSYFGKMSDSFRRVPLMASGMLIAGGFSLLIPHLNSLLMLALANVVVAIGWAAADPAEAALVADLSNHETRGRSFGWYAFAGSLGAIFGPLLGGWLYSQIGVAAPFYLNGFILLMTSALAIILLGRLAVSPHEEG